MDNNSIFMNNEDDFKRLYLNSNKKIIKEQIKQFIIHNTKKIHQQLLDSRTVEAQISVINLILKVFNKEEIIKNDILNVHSKILSVVNRNNKNSVLYFLKEFSILEPECTVLGAVVEILKIKDKEIREGYIFTGEESFRYQKNNEVVIIQYKSIREISFKGVELDIFATEDRKVYLRFVYEKDIKRFKDFVIKRFNNKINNNFNCGEMEVEEPISVEIGKRVRFDLKGINENKEESNNPNNGNNDLNINNLSNFNNSGNNLCNNSNNNSNDLTNSNNSNDLINSISTDNNINSSSSNDCSLNKKNVVKKLLKNNKKHKSSFNLKSKIHSIFNDKLKIAKLIYKLFKKDAIEFKRQAEKYK